jgi:hypothetical protein
MTQSETLKGRNHVEDLKVNGRKISRRFLGKEDDME